jgi:hypothetical protein
MKRIKGDLKELRKGQARMSHKIFSTNTFSLPISSKGLNLGDWPLSSKRMRLNGHKI